MLLFPKKTKYRKMHKMVNHRMEHRTIMPSFGDYALKATTNGRISAAQIEAARRVISRKIKKIGKWWIRIFPSVPVTEKPLAVRMGKGKGYVEYWVAPIKSGQILFELKGVSESVAQEVLLKASHKLSVKTKFVNRKKLK